MDLRRVAPTQGEFHNVVRSAPDSATKIPAAEIDRDPRAILSQVRRLATFAVSTRGLVAPAKFILLKLCKSLVRVRR
jgi:hypothetical protein